MDSSEFAYAEVELDNHATLIAQGNVGKSSLINAIRLFFLPECSFKNQKTHFGFADSHGEFYSSQATFNHYFPSKYSFLILEYEKRLYDGPHCCQIITTASANQLRVERMFTQLPYAQLQHLFWQAGDDELGIGERNDALSKQAVYEYIQQHDSTCVLVKDEQKVAELIYQSELQQSRYTLFPLKEPSKQNIDALRALIKLLFIASSKNEKPFTAAIANIIETGKKSSQDKLSFDIQAFKQQHELLKEQEQQLNRILNLQSAYNKILANRDKCLTFMQTLKNIKPGLAWLDTGARQLNAELAELTSKKDKTEQKEQQLKSQVRQLETDIKQAQLSLKKATKECGHFQKTLNTINKVKTEFVNMDLADIIEILQEDQADKQQQLDVLQGNISRDEAIAALETERQHKTATLAKLTTAQANRQWQLAAQLPSDTANVLFSVRKELAYANTGQALSAEHKAAIEAFTQLFAVSSTDLQPRLGFFDQSIAYHTFVEEDLSARIERTEQEINGIYKRLSQLKQEQGSALHTDETIKQLQTALSLLKSDLQALADNEYATRRVAELTIDMTNIDAELVIAQAQLNETLDKFSKAQQRARDARLAYTHCQDTIREHQQLMADLSKLATRYTQWLDLLPDDAEFSGYINAQMIENFDSSALNLERLKNSLVNQLRTFVEEEVIVDAHGIREEAPLWNEVTATISALNEIYEHLPTQQTLLQQQIEEHNATIGTKKAIIVQNYEMIQSFTRSINQAFKGITINNVASVEFSIVIDKQFQDLVTDLATTNLYSQQLLSEDFYVRLVAFAERFFGRDEVFNLTMEAVIKGFEPQVQLHNKATKEDKMQSNSTNALIKIKLLQLLLRRLLAHDCATALPIVYDEIANIDISQFDWWLDDLGRSGFHLIAAGTHSTSPALQAKIGNRHVMDALHSGKPYHGERARVFWRGPETFTPPSEQVQTELGYA